MFTGIVEEMGALLSRHAGRMRFAAGGVLDGIALGDSTAVNGCCLTVVAWAAPEGGEPGWWEADVSEETFARTSLGSLRPGDAVNLERPVRPVDRLGGHLVQGHVDAVGEVLAVVPELEVEVPAPLMRYLVEKGSVTVDGVSLTVVDVRDASFTVAVIPHTAEVTTLGRRRVGDPVNIEVDVVAKYVERLAIPYAGPPSGRPVAGGTKLRGEDERGGVR
ncbi:MAG: riboflavin synthase [Microthrixaceae bacterium]